MAAANCCKHVIKQLTLNIRCNCCEIFSLFAVSNALQIIAMFSNLHACSAGSYLGNFSHHPTRNETDWANVTRVDHVEEILRNPLGIFRIIHRLELLLRSLNELRFRLDFGQSCHSVLPLQPVPVCIRAQFKNRFTLIADEFEKPFPELQLSFTPRFGGCSSCHSSDSFRILSHCLQCNEYRS